jgi:hypothetical protein
MEVQVTVLCPLGRVRRYRRRTLLVASYRTRTRSRTPIRLPCPIPAEAWSPPNLIPPLPHHPTLILLSRKHHSPSIPLHFHPSPHHPTLTIPLYNKPRALRQHPHSLPTSPKTLPTIPFIPFHLFPHLSTLTALNNKNRATPKHSHSPLHLPTTHNLRHSQSSTLTQLQTIPLTSCNSDTHTPSQKEITSIETRIKPLQKNKDTKQNKRKKSSK